MTHTRSPRIVISGSGLWTPAESITNDELVNSYNAWAAKFNTDHAAAVAAGQIEEKPMSSARFIEKASGIKARHVYTRDGILDINRMRPKIPERGEDDISHQAEIAVLAARQAMEAAGKTAADIDAVIVSCAYTQRAYPAIAIEVQNVLGIEGFGFDMLMACSAATFGLHRAYDSLMAGSASCVLAVNPELVTPQVNYCDRDSHFIFGDVSTAVIMERAETAAASALPFEVLGTKALTRFSSSIRSNFGYMSRAADTDPYGWDKLFHQAGRKVFEEVSPIAAAHIRDHLASLGIRPEEVRRFWLHQANLNMNKRVIRELMGKDLDADLAPMILDTYGNTASAGSIVAFHLYNADLQPGDIGVICSFGAGYSAGSLVVRKR
ncbi:MAG: beta-ketoacyl-ACP synthase III [Desulfobacteraceae bacterium]|nr:MAG: beta-ketoacyl-ACP synthase III [Desulfobacteraceae bacterium]